MSGKNLPPNWAWVKLGDVCNKITDGTHFTPKYISSGVPFISVKDIYNDKIHFENCKYISKSEHNVLIKRCNPEFGDVLITKSGTIGRIAVVTNKKEFSLFVSVALLKPNKDLIDSNFLSMTLKNHINNIDISQTIKGGLLKNYHIEDIKATHIPLPSLSIQKSIVTKIEELFSELDSGVASLKKAKEQIKTYRQSVLASAFSGRLNRLNLDLPDSKINRIKTKNESGKSDNHVNQGSDNFSSELPAGWRWVKLGEAAYINPKLPYADISNETMVTFLPMKKVKELSGEFDLSEERKYSEVKKGFTPFTNGDVIFAKITPCMENGKIAVLNNLKNKIGFGSTEFHVFRTKEELINQYLFYYLIQESFRGDAQHNMTGAVGQKRVSRLFLENSIIPLPSIKEQLQIIEEIEKRFSEADNLEKAIDESLAKAETLRQSILKQAFEGRLVNEE